MNALNKNYQAPLPEGVTFSLWLGENPVPVFTSGGKWLHPIFDAEKYLSGAPAGDTLLYAHDSAVGKAAAVLLVYNGVRYIHADLASSLAVKFIEKYNSSVQDGKKITFSCGRLVERFGCATEKELENLDDLQLMYNLTKRRA